MGAGELFQADLTAAYLRTDAGRLEIRARSHPLSRPARNLLLVIDGHSSGGEWVRKVQGSTAADLQQLVDLGLVAIPAAQKAVATAAATRAPAAPPATGAAASASAAAAPATAGLEEAIARWPYSPLYDLLTHEARERFGLIRGYKLILEVEQCANLGQLQQLALRFVLLLQSLYGDLSAAQLRKRLLAGPPPAADAP